MCGREERKAELAPEVRRAVAPGVHSTELVFVQLKAAPLG